MFDKKINYFIFVFLQQFSNEIFREKLAIWITVDDQPFTVTESQEFKELFELCNKNAELPSADTVRRDVLKLYSKYRADVKHMLQVSHF